MKTLAHTFTRFLLAVAFLVLPGLAAAQTVLNPSFETLGQANWTPVLNGPAAWTDSAATPPVTNGVNGVSSSQGGPSSQILYQDVVLPTTGTYVFSVDVGCNASGGATTDFCRVDLTDTSAASITPPTPGVDTLATTTGGVVTPVYSRNGTAGPGAQGTTSVSFNGTAGQTVRIRFMVQASNFFAFIFLDNVAFAIGPASGVPALSEWSLILLAMLLGLAAMYFIRRTPMDR